MRCLWGNEVMFGGGNACGTDDDERFDCALASRSFRCSRSSRVLLLGGIPGGSGLSRARATTERMKSLPSSQNGLTSDVTYT